MPEKMAQEQGKNKSLAAKKAQKMVLGPKREVSIMFCNDELNKQTILPVIDCQISLRESKTRLSSFAVHFILFVCVSFPREFSSRPTKLSGHNI